MDLTTAAAPTGFMGWFNQYGQVIYIIMQMGFWILVGVAAAIAAAKYSQWVDFVTGRTSKKKAAPAAPDAILGDLLEADE